MNILIVGGTGSLGKKLISHFLDRKDIVNVISRDEAKHWTIKNSLYSKGVSPASLRFFVGDIRDEKRLNDVIYECNPSVVITAAALKQVDTCELSPNESVATNVVGTSNVLSAVENYARNASQQVKLLHVSTDKACSPVNVYGMCKALSERLVTNKKSKNVTHLCVRYGNVLESRGSILPLFKWQSANADAITLTHEDMTRYFMTLNQSVNLIQEALDECLDGQIRIPKLPSMRIKDLAEIFSEMYGNKKKIKIVGMRPGEKIHEELINTTESARTKEVYTKNSSAYVISSAIDTQKECRLFTYSSDQVVMTKQELHQRLNILGVFDKPIAAFEGKTIEEISTIANT